MTSLTDLASRIQKIENKDQFFVEHINNKTKELDVVQKALDELNLCIDLCEKCLTDKSNIKSEIEKALNILLEALFEEYNIKYAIETTYKDDKVTVAGFKSALIENGYTNGLSSDGVQDSLSYGFRLLGLVFNPELRQFQYVDEIGPHLNGSKIPLIFDFTGNLQELRPDLQLMVVTHVDGDYSGKKYRISRENGDAKITDATTT